MKEKEQHKHKPARTVEICKCGAAREPGGEWGSLAPRFAGRALIARYLQSSTPEERSENAKKSAQSRWGGKDEERVKYMQAIAKRPRPRAVKEHCPCGKFSLQLADKRGHKCKAPETAA